MLRTIHRTLGLSVLFAALSIFAPLAEGQTKIGIGLATTHDNSFVAEIALEEGLFAKYGLEAKLTAFSNAPLTLQALLSGSVQFAATPPLPAMLARATGADIRMIAVLIPSVPFSLYASKSVKTPADLTGAAGIYFGPGSLSYFVAQLYLPALGVDPASITWTASREMAAQLMAVSQEQAKLCFLPDNQRAKAEELGVKVLVSSTELSKIAKFPYASIATTSSFLKQRPDVVRNTLMALGEATKVMQTKPKAAAAAIMKWNPGYTQEYADAAIKDAAATSPLVPSIDERQIEVMRKLLVATGTKEANAMTPAEFYDDSLVKALDQSGFYKK